MENAVWLVCSVTALWEHGHTSCSNIMLYSYNISLLAVKEKVKEVEENLEKKEKKVSKVFEVEHQMILYAERSGVYDRNRCRRGLFHASVSKIAIQFWRKESKKTQSSRRLTTMALDTLSLST